LRGRLVVGHVGSLNRAYKIQRSFELARRVLENREDAVFLLLSHQRQAAEAAARAAGIPPDRVVVKSVDPEHVVDYLRAMDWGLLFRSNTFASRAAMPTKFAEFVAVGVRPVQWGGNDDLRHWVRCTGAGLALDDLSDA